MICYDFEVFRYDWMVSYLDTETRQMHTIVNDRDAFIDFYNQYKYRVWVGYNSRGYDQWIAKGILAGFNPWDINDWIINKDRQGWEFSKLLHEFTILNYDCMVGFRSLKELEAFMGHDIRESNVPWDIKRPLTPEELADTQKYCEHDVMETFMVFVETKSEFESHLGLITEFNLPATMINKTKAQLSAVILGASQVDRDDEFDISFPDTMDLGRYEWIQDWYKQWAESSRDYKNVLDTDIAGVPHNVSFGGLHGAREKYMSDGYFILADVSSYYPALMIEYNFLSRNVLNPEKFKVVRDERLVLKARNDPTEYPRKIVINSTFGASKDKYNALYDPLMANNTCINGQLFLIDLIDKVEGECEIIQSNTDGVLMKLYAPQDKEIVKKLAIEWGIRTRFDLDFEEYVRVIQKDVNNYIIVGKDGSVKRKGSYVKKLSPLDNDLPIVNKAVVDYFIHDTPVRNTIYASNKLIDFQKITKVSSKYEYAYHSNMDGELMKLYGWKKNTKGEKVRVVRKYKGNRLHEKVYRTFATKDPKYGILYKKHKQKDFLDKTAGTPEKCRIINSNIEGMEVPKWIDREWYVKLAEKRIQDFIN